jgi:hypothetical protein
MDSQFFLPPPPSLSAAVSDLLFLGLTILLLLASLGLIAVCDRLMEDSK